MSEARLTACLARLLEAVRSGSREEAREALRAVDELLSSDASGRYSVLYLLLVSLGDELGLDARDRVAYLIKSHRGLVECLRGVLRAWVERQRELIWYLEDAGIAEHPLANVFVVGELLGLVDPLSPETYVLRGNVYLNYLRVLKEYEGRSGYQLMAQSERAFRNALELYTRALSIDLNHCDAYVGLARLYRTAGDLEQAAANYENALRCRHLCSLAKELAEVYLLRGDREAASRALEGCPEADVG